MAQKDVPDWFSFYPYEFMEDEHVVAMTLEERGAYITLLCRQWANGSIPSDIPALARILKRTTTEMEMMWPALAPCFPAHPELNLRLANARLEHERSVTINRIEGASKGGKVAAEKRRLAKLGSSQLASQPEVNLKSTSGQPLCSVLYLNKEEEVKKNGDKWGEFKRLYPAHKFDESRACQAWLSKDGEGDAILSGLKEWAGSESWREHGGKFVNKASNFIFEEVYKLKPQGAEQSPAPTLVSTMDPDLKRKLEERRRNGG